MRINGAIASIFNKNQKIEYRTDVIQEIRISKDVLILEIQMKGDVWRRLPISIIKPNKEID